MVDASVIYQLDLSQRLVPTAIVHSVDTLAVEIAFAASQFASQRLCFDLLYCLAGRCIAFHASGDFTNHKQIGILVARVMH